MVASGGGGVAAAGRAGDRGAVQGPGVGEGPGAARGGAEQVRGAFAHGRGREGAGGGLHVRRHLAQSLGFRPPRT